MIHEAMDAADSVISALAVWIVLAALWAAWRVVRRTVRAVMPRRTPSACAWRPRKQATALASVDKLTAPTAEAQR